MIEKLRKFYPSLEYYMSAPTEMNPELKWFNTVDGQVIGIHPSNLEEKDLLLLHTFLQPYQNLYPPMTKEEKKWNQWIQTEDGHPDIDVRFRFVYFQIPANHIQPQAFKEAINQLFEKDVTILWENETEGVIVDIANEELEESISYKEIIDILMSDLYVNIRFFVGPHLFTLDKIRKYYQRLVSGARVAFGYTENNVLYYAEALPFIIMDQTDQDFRDELQQLILQEFQSDTEFVKMLEVFLDSNLNISVAAKKLYMHRNSLQYRIDKFQEKTGLDIRIFHHALTVYLALIATKK